MSDEVVAVVPVPDQLAAVTPEWLTAVLAGDAGDRAASARVASTSFDRVGEGVGLMGELARFVLDWQPADASRPGRVIVKLPGTDPDNRATGQILGLYERESRFYLELASELPIRTPRCLHSAFEPNPNAPADPEAFERRIAKLPMWLTRGLLSLGERLAKRAPLGAVIVLEDLDGLRPGDQLHGGDARDWGLAIDTLAQLHAAGWEREPWLSHTWLARMRPNVRINQAIFSRQYRRLSPAWAERLGDEGGRIGTWLVKHGVPLMQSLGTAPDTLCHSDYRLDNLFFDDTRDEVVVIDWQLASRGPGVLDLSYFLSGVMGPSVTVAEEEAFVQRYHAGLIEGGVEHYPLGVCLADYRRAYLANWQRCIASASSVETEDERGSAMLESWWDRTCARLDGLDPDAILAARG